MRILFYLSDLTVGGCQINAINLAIALKNRGHVIYILSDKGILIQRLIDNGIEHLQIDQNVRHFSIKNSLIIANFVKNLNIDIVQAFDPIFSIEAYTSKYFHGKQIIGMITAQRLPVFYLPKLRPTLFVNPSIIDKYVKFYKWNSDCTYLLKERLDLNLYYPSLIQSNAYIGQGRASKKIITLISRVDLDKLLSIHLFINLVEFVHNKHPLDEYIFYIAGDGPLINDIEKIIIEKNLQNSLFLLGQVENINELTNSSYAIVAMASTCQQSLAAGKPTFVIGNSGFLQLVEESNFNELSYFHFNVHEKTTTEVKEYFYSCLIEKLNSQDFMRNYFLFAVKSAKLFSSNEGAAKLEKLYESVFMNKFNMKSWFFYTFQLLHSFISYFKYLVLRKLKCVE